LVDRQKIADTEPDSSVEKLLPAGYVTQLVHDLLLDTLRPCLLEVTAGPSPILVQPPNDLCDSFLIGMRSDSLDELQRQFLPSCMLMTVRKIVNDFGSLSV